MAHVGIKRFRAGHRQKDAPERDDADRAMRLHETKARDWAQRLQNAPTCGNMDKTEHGVDREEQDHNRPEEGGDPGGSPALRGEEQHEDDDRRRQHIARQVGVDLFQSFERGKDRNRRGDDGVARKEGRTGDAEQKHDRPASPDRALGERHQG